jgi:transcriptional regulator with XRE-family HTH domain
MTSMTVTTVNRGTSSDVPSSDVPSSDVPSSDVPSSDVPSSDVPSSDVPSSGVPSSGRAIGLTRRTELAAFLRSRRERICPEDVGLPAGGRRRTAGLRREELAQLAGVGVTWYTWLEQGRPIHASVQVLDAIARTLRLDATERGHLFRLAEVPGAAGPGDCVECPLPPEVQRVLDAIPFPASVTTERFDLLAWNAIYASLFPRVTQLPPGDRNTLVSCLTGPACCSPLPEQDKYSVTLVAQLRAAYGRHVGDPAWTHFIARLQALSPQFAATWAEHDVAQPASHTKRFRHPTLGLLTTTSTSFAVNAVPGARMVVYTPDDPHSERAIARLAAGEELTARFPCFNSHADERARLTPAAS